MVKVIMDEIKATVKKRFDQEKSNLFYLRFYVPLKIRKLTLLISSRQGREVFRGIIVVNVYFGERKRA
jgi:hypothetical protein